MGNGQSCDHQMEDVTSRECDGCRGSAGARQDVGRQSPHVHKGTEGGEPTLTSLG